MLVQWHSAPNTTAQVGGTGVASFEANFTYKNEKPRGSTRGWQRVGMRTWLVWVGRRGPGQHRLSCTNRRMTIREVMMDRMVRMGFNSLLLR